MPPSTPSANQSENQPAHENENDLSERIQTAHPSNFWNSLRHSRRAASISSVSLREPCWTGRDLSPLCGASGKATACESSEKVAENRTIPNLWWRPCFSPRQLSPKKTDFTGDIKGATSDTDNGGEFVNHHHRHFTSRERPVEMTRSRPYHKNDQAHVEQKNPTHVRQLLGHERLGNNVMLKPLAELLEAWSAWRNCYTTSFKQIESRREARP